MTTTATRPARLFANRDGALACAHRNSFVCPECFARTPGLIDVFGEVYRYHPEEWEDATLAAECVLSPGTSA